MVDETNGITAKVLVLGDQSVGKSSLVHLLVEQRVLHNARWTVGCSVDVVVMPPVAPSSERVFVSLWDVGGASRFEQSRELFYADADAVLLVHDLTNRRSYSNLRRWLRELTAYFNPSANASTTQWASSEQSSDFGFGFGNNSSNSNDGNDTDGSLEGGNAGSALDLVQLMQLDLGAGGPPLPVLVLGNKLDEVVGTSRLDVEGGAADSVHVSAHDLRAFAPGSVGGGAISRLFEGALARARTRLASIPTLPSSVRVPTASPSGYADSKRASTSHRGATSPPPSNSIFSQLDSDNNVFGDSARIDTAPTSITSILSGGGSGRRKADKKD